MGENLSVGTEQRQCSCEAAARSSQGIPGQQQHKEASCARHQIFWRKEKVGVLVGGPFFQKKNIQTPKKHVFFFRCLYFFCWSDASNVNISLWHVLWTAVTGLQMELRILETLFGIADSDPCRIEALDSPPPKRLETGETWWYRSLLPGISGKNTLQRGWNFGQQFLRVS